MNLCQNCHWWDSIEAQGYVNERWCHDPEIMKHAAVTETMPTGPDDGSGCPGWKQREAPLIEMANDPSTWRRMPGPPPKATHDFASPMVLERQFGTLQVGDDYFLCEFRVPSTWDGKIIEITSALVTGEKLTRERAEELLAELRAGASVWP